MEQRGDGMSIGYLGMLENIHKNADAFNTFSTSMRWKEFDRFSDQRISRWISMMIYIYFHHRFPPLFFLYLFTLPHTCFSQ